MAGSIIAVEDISLAKEDILESKQFASTARKIVFAHKATGGESGINLLSLITPTELSANGFVQPSTAEIAASRAIFNKKNFRLISSINGELWMHDHYVITSEAFISFLNGITALPGEIFRGEIIDVPQAAVITADARSVTRTYQLAVGQTLLNLGVLYKVGENLTANSQIGSIKVWRNGSLQMRNVGNAAASPTADGNYQEYDPANLGTSNQIQFNIAPIGQTDEVIVEFGLHVFSGDVEIYGAIEQLHGMLFKLAQDAAPAFGNPLSTYLSANPSQVDRRQFGNLVLGLLDLQVPIVTPWTSYTPGFQGFGTVTGVEFEWRQIGEDVEINGKWTNGTVTAVEGRIDLPPGKTTFAYPTFRLVGMDANTNPSGDNNYVVAKPSVTYLNPIRSALASSNLGTVFNAGETHSIFASVRIANQQATQTIRQYLQSIGAI